MLKFLHKSIWGRYALCFTLCLILVGLKLLLLEPQSGYEAARLWTYDKIQRQLSADKSVHSSVRIVSIDGIPKEDPIKVAAPEGTDEATATSRDQLLALFRVIAASHPKAIAVDIDFSADSHGNPIVVDDGDKFFPEVHKISTQFGVPIFLGVDRHAADPEADWLGAKNEDLAVGLAIGNDLYQGPAQEMHSYVDYVLRMFCWTQVRGGPSKLKSLAFAAGRTAKPEDSELPSYLAWAIESESDFTMESAIDTRGFLVDYSSVDDLFNHKTSFRDILKPKSEQPQTFDGKVVILGATSSLPDDGRVIQRTSDLFRIPGHNRLYSGVLLHGCAVDTLDKPPLRQWTKKGRLAADFGLTLLANTLIECFMWIWLLIRKHPHHNGMILINWPVTVFSMACVVVIAFPFVQLLRLVWDDAIIVALALAIHTGIDHWLTHKIHSEDHHGPDIDSHPEGLLSVETLPHTDESQQPNDDMPVLMEGEHEHDQ